MDWQQSSTVQPSSDELSNQPMTYGSHDRVALCFVRLKLFPFMLSYLRSFADRQNVVARRS